jgi:hypothetical protein
VLQDDVDRLRDRYLVAQARGGDREAFEVLRLRYAQRLFRLCVGRLQDQRRAHEVVDASFRQAEQRLHDVQVDEDRAFYSWLSLIASDLCGDVLERRQKVDGVFADTVSLASASSEGGRVRHALRRRLGRRSEEDKRWALGTGTASVPALRHLFGPAGRPGKSLVTHAARTVSVVTGTAAIVTAVALVAFGAAPGVRDPGALRTLPLAIGPSPPAHVAHGAPTSPDGAGQGSQGGAHPSAPTTGLSRSDLTATFGRPSTQGPDEAGATAAGVVLDVAIHGYAAGPADAAEPGSQSTGHASRVGATTSTPVPGGMASGGTGGVTTMGSSPSHTGNDSTSGGSATTGGGGGTASGDQGTTTDTNDSPAGGGTSSGGTSSGGTSPASGTNPTPTGTTTNGTLTSPGGTSSGGTSSGGTSSGGTSPTPTGTTTNGTLTSPGGTSSAPDGTPTDGIVGAT